MLSWLRLVALCVRFLPGCSLRRVTRARTHARTHTHTHTHTHGGGGQALALDYTLVACEDSSPHIHALVLQRSQKASVGPGDTASVLMRDDAGQTAVSECRVVRVRSPYLFYYAFDAEHATHAAGTLVLNGYEPIALHRHHCPATVATSDSILSALSCAPPRNPSAKNDAQHDIDAGPRKKGVLLTAILDHLVAQLPASQAPKAKPRKPRPKPPPPVKPDEGAGHTPWNRACSLSLFPAASGRAPKPVSPPPPFPAPSLLRYLRTSLSAHLAAKEPQASSAALDEHKLLFSRSS